MRERSPSSSSTRLILWDNYPVNDLSMSDGSISPALRSRLPPSEALYGYLNNPLLQEELSFIPLATCFDYAAQPRKLPPEASWSKIVVKRFGIKTLPHWQRIRMLL